MSKTRPPTAAEHRRLRAAQSDFAARLSAMKIEAGRIGLVRTMHAFDRPHERYKNRNETRGEPEVMGPLAVVGWEIADILQGKQVVLAGRGRIGRK